MTQRFSIHIDLGQVPTSYFLRTAVGIHDSEEVLSDSSYDDKIQRWVLSFRFRNALEHARIREFFESRGTNDVRFLVKPHNPEAINRVQHKLQPAVDFLKDQHGRGDWSSPLSGNYQWDSDFVPFNEVYGLLNAIFPPAELIPKAPALV